MTIPMIEKKSYIAATWPAPENVKALVTTRISGHSESLYDSYNLAEHVGDDLKNVAVNREKLKADLNLIQEPFWLRQTHSDICLPWQVNDTSTPKEADASYTTKVNQACVVMTADCLPILFCNKQGDWVAACHAGWRGLANGVIEKTLESYQGKASDLLAWIGPAISQRHFEVGEDVRDLFLNKSRALKKYNGDNSFFEKNKNQRYQFDFIGLAKCLLESFEITVSLSDLCSYEDNERFYSYRRDGQTGRMASLIWFE